jgi:hypothetical protein
MAIKKSDLYSSIWASCDELRGGMDASQYKDYVLFMLFIKYVSDRYGDSSDSVPPVVIPKGRIFSDMRALKGQPDIGDKTNAMPPRCRSSLMKSPSSRPRWTNTSKRWGLRYDKSLEAGKVPQ